MNAPAIVVVDSDPAALSILEEALRNRYASDYAVIGIGSPEKALARLGALAETGTAVALVLVAEGIAGATGGELLDYAGRLHPLAKRALLVPWPATGDPETAREIYDSMSLGRMDYYALKPATPSDELFHGAISSFLLDWSKGRLSSPHTVHVIGETWSGRAYEIRDTLQRCAAPHAFHLAESEAGRDLLARVDQETGLPLMILPSGEVLVNPTDLEIAKSVSATVDPDHDEFDVAIVGAGPAGLSAAVNSASEGLSTQVVDSGGIGGQATSSSLIRNYLGFPQGVSGGQLASQAYDQAWMFGANFAFMQPVTDLERDGDHLVLTLPGQSPVRARTVVLATGSQWRRLGVPALEALRGAGVFYGGPVSEAQAMSGADVHIVGGANSAGQAALHLARYARSVTLVVRASSLEAGMSHYLIRELHATSNVDIRLETTVIGGGGETRLERLLLRSSDGSQETVPSAGLFVLIGAHPNTDWLPESIARDESGFLLTGSDLTEAAGWPLERAPFAHETSLPGVFAAGDARHGSVKRVGSAVGEGAETIQRIQALFACEPFYPRTSARA
jgi:thioredoxin reductase (NADPH)